MPKRGLAVKANDAIDERLLAGALQVFLDKGFAAATIEQIAAQAKASKLTFYNRYGNKESLFEAVVNRQNVALLEVLSGSVPNDLPVKEFLHSVAGRFQTALLQNENVALLRVLHVEAERFPKLADFFDKAGPARAAQLLAAELKSYMDRGVLGKADPLLAAEHFLHLSLGEITRRILLGVRPSLTKAEIHKRITSGIDVFLKAYAR